MKAAGRNVSSGGGIGETRMDLASIRYLHEGGLKSAD
jgi:hypothetical protein